MLAHRCWFDNCHLKKSVIKVYELLVFRFFSSRNLILVCLQLTDGDVCDGLRF